MWGIKWLILWTLWAARLVRQPTTPVLVTNGWIRGSIANSGVYKQYMGIPYATVINQYQAPGPEPTWEGVFEADREHIRCRQLFQEFGVSQNSKVTAIGQDDCLILNIYTPLNAPSKPLPVMVLFHGGGFLQGSSSKVIFGPEHLTSKGVVLVAINYRLAVEGFLCLGIKEAPGNAGMKDQVAALKWVQRNIKQFGGDPDNVTIFGESAGGASVSFHVVSPISKGLFHKAIQQSGSSLASWAMQYEPIAITLLKAKAAGYTGTSDDPYELYNFFKSKTASEIITSLTERIEGNIAQSRILFLPCIEKNIEGVEPFLTESPQITLSKGTYNRVPMIIGANSEEGILFASMESKDYIPKVKIEIALPRNLEYPNDKVKREIANDVQRLYLNGDEKSINSEQYLQKICRYYGEPFFNYPAIEETELILKTSDQPVFSYVFSYYGWKNIAKMLLSFRELRSMPGATHADELFYLFNQDILPNMFENRMIEAMTTMWTNFAKFGNPTPEVSELLPVSWPRMSLEDQRSLVIDSTFSIAPQWYNNSTLPYWKNIYAKYRRKK